jgi:hypothetical protein
LAQLPWLKIKNVDWLNPVEPIPYIGIAEPFKFTDFAHHLISGFGPVNLVAKEIKYFAQHLGMLGLMQRCLSV